jgi:predicted nuclease with TOPRIM domain
MATTLTKEDLSAIRGVVKDELEVTNKKIDKNYISLKKRFDELFDFLDRKYVQLQKEVREIQGHLHLPVSDF